MTAVRQSRQRQLAGPTAPPRACFWCGYATTLVRSVAPGWRFLWEQRQEDGSSGSLPGGSESLPIMNSPLCIQTMRQAQPLRGAWSVEALARPPGACAARSICRRKSGHTEGQRDGEDRY